jgi:hypothetical protein
MGWYIIMEPSTVKKRKKRLLAKCVLTFLWRWEEFEIAHLATSDGIGIELFSFPHRSKKHQNSTFQYRDFSFFVYKIKHWRPHRKIVSYGGKQRMPIREYYPKQTIQNVLRRRSFQLFRNIHTVMSNLFFGRHTNKQKVNRIYWTFLNLTKMKKSLSTLFYNGCFLQRSDEQENRNWSSKQADSLTHKYSKLLVGQQVTGVTVRAPQDEFS